VVVKRTRETARVNLCRGPVESHLRGNPFEEGPRQPLDGKTHLFNAQQTSLLPHFPRGLASKSVIARGPVIGKGCDGWCHSPIRDVMLCRHSDLFSQLMRQFTCRVKMKLGHERRWRTKAVKASLGRLRQQMLTRETMHSYEFLQWAQKSFTGHAVYTATPLSLDRRYFRQYGAWVKVIHTPNLHSTRILINLVCKNPSTVLSLLG
jgi:hypothetical protein